VAGNDPELDIALKLWPHIQTFLRQESDEVAAFDETLKVLLQFGGVGT
jgi:flagellar biosynthesis/type III secretory pathway ATPase